MPTDGSGGDSYGGFKAVAEAALAARHIATGFPATVVRPAAIYGPNNNIYDMEAPMFLRLLQHRPILLPHSGLVTASYGHVDDLCDVMVAMTGVAASFGEVINITAEAVTTGRYVDVLATIIGVEADIVPVPDEALTGLPGGIFGHLFGRNHHAVLSIDKAQRLLGFVPRYDFASGHTHTYEWFRAERMHELDGPLADPVWRASWDFDAEAAAAAQLR
jgi:nucleoside-diphosphate-sugar epimerase